MIRATLLGGPFCGTLVNAPKDARVVSFRGLLYFQTPLRNNNGQPVYAYPGTEDCLGKMEVPAS